MIISSVYQPHTALPSRARVVNAETCGKQWGADLAIEVALVILRGRASLISSIPSSVVEHGETRACQNAGLAVPVQEAEGIHHRQNFIESRSRGYFFGDDSAKWRGQHVYRTELNAGTPTFFKPKKIYMKLLC